MQPTLSPGGPARPSRGRLCGLLLLTLTAPLPGSPEASPDAPPLELEELTVVAPEPLEGFGLPRLDLSDPTGFEVFSLDSSLPMGSAPDPARWMRQVPGAAPVSNGPLSGQIQLRGMWGYRVDTRVDGMVIPAGCANFMDPSLHYAPVGLLDRLEVHRGLAPVRLGAETIGGVVRAHTRSGALRAPGEARRTRTYLSLGASSVDEGRDATFFTALEGSDEWVHAFGTVQRGDDHEFGRPGLVSPTRYDREQVGAGWGTRLGTGSLSLEVRHQDTDETGTPALPMDATWFDTDLLRLGYEGLHGGTQLEGKLYYTSVHHLMDNYTLRPPPDFFTPPPAAPPGMQAAYAGTERRASLGRALGLGVELQGRRPAGVGELRFGTDALFATYDKAIFDPDSPMRTTPFSDIERDRVSLFGEWEGPLGPGLWDLEAGLRVTHVRASAGAGTRPGMAPAARLWQRFVDADRSREDTDLDVVLRASRTLRRDLELEVGIGRKTRSPSYIERFAYLPIEATSGFADGNKTVGSLDLESEAAHSLDVGVSWRSPRGYLSPRVFYTEVDDYILQVPTTDPDTVAVATVNGDPTPFRFQNVEARLHGADAAFGRRLSKRWRLDGTVSWVRGRRTDVADDLFRTAPLNGTLSLTHEHRGWACTAQAIMAARQDDVSRVFGEPETPGWGILNLFARGEIGGGARLHVGMENVLDQYHRNHLAAFNRVIGSDVGAIAPPLTTAARIPGRGRNFFLRVDLEF